MDYLKILGCRQTYSRGFVLERCK